MHDDVSLPVLYSFRRCPYAMRARLALAQAGHAVQLREVLLRDKPPELLAVSPAATVPVLVLPDRVLVHSLDIMRWAWQGHDPDGWLTRSEAPEHQALIDANDSDFKRALDRYKYAERFPDRPASAYRDDAVVALIAALEPRLAVQPQLGGAMPCLTDLALMPFVRQFAAVDAAWWAQAPLPATRAWLQGWLAHPLFATAMVASPCWAPGDAPVVFPGQSLCPTPGPILQSRRPVASSG